MALEQLNLVGIESNPNIKILVAIIQDSCLKFLFMCGVQCAEHKMKMIMSRLQCAESNVQMQSVECVVLSTKCRSLLLTSKPVLSPPCRTHYAREGSYTHWLQCHQACRETWLRCCVMVPLWQEYGGHHGAHPTIMASYYHLLHHLLFLPCWLLASHAQHLLPIYWW